MRDLWLMKGQVAAICLVIAAGVATFVMSVSALQSLQGTLDAYYERYRFADAFVHLKRAPQALAERVAEVPGVSQVCTFRDFLKISIGDHYCTLNCWRGGQAWDGRTGGQEPAPRAR